MYHLPDGVVFYHWKKLPKHFRDRIWNAYRPGQEITMTPSEEYIQVAKEVQEWILTTYN